MMISYGGYGDEKAAEQLKQALQGVRMQPTHRMMGLTFPTRAEMVQAAKGEDLGLSGDVEGATWAEEQEEIVKAFEELMGLLNA